MPGSVSDSYDPEWGTAAVAEVIRDQIRATYGVVSGVLGNVAPIYIGELVHSDLGNAISATLSEKQWRLIRFALERAEQSI